jgi:probable HAF family extracellular repeat protein
MTYTILDIGILPGAQSTNAFGINNSRQIVGCCTYPNGETHAFVWDQTNGMQDISLANAPNSQALAINAVGQIAGASNYAFMSPNDLAVMSATLWTNNAVSELVVDVNGSAAQSINGSGVAACNVGTNNQNYAAKLSSAGLVPLGPVGPGLGVMSSYGNGINDAEQVVGAIQIDAAGDTHAALWDSAGNMQDLGTSGDSSTALAINNAQTVVGEFHLNSSARGFVWMPNVPGMRDLNPGGPAFTPFGLNARGDVVGIYAGTGLAGIILSGGTVQDLNPLVPAGSPQLQIAKGIDDSGDIIAWSTSGAVTRSYLLVPVPIKHPRTQPVVNRCGNLLARYLQLNADIGQRELNLSNLGWTPARIAQDPSVSALSEAIASLSTEMTNIGCPPPTLIKLPRVADRQP